MIGKRKRNYNYFINIDHALIWEFDVTANWNSWDDSVNLLRWVDVIMSLEKKEKFLGHTRSYYHIVSTHKIDDNA